MIEYHSDKMPFIPTMYDITDLFANFANNWYHLRFVFSLLFGISFGFWLMKKVLEGFDEVISIGEAASRAKDSIERVGERMKFKAGIQADIAKDRAAASLDRAKERSQAMLQNYGENYRAKLDMRYQAKLDHGDFQYQQKLEQQQAVVFLAALGVRKDREAS